MRPVSDLIIALVPTAEVSLFVFVLKRGECPNKSRRVDFSRVGSSSTGCDVFKFSAHCQKLTMITFNIVNISHTENFILTIFHFVNISHIDNIPCCQYLTLTRVQESSFNFFLFLKTCLLYSSWKIGPRKKCQN